MNMKDTCFGYTDGMIPMKKAKVENTLNELIRYDGQVISNKEYVYLKLQSGYKPSVDHDVTHYSRRLGEQTKPKTEYYLLSNDFSSTINKTLYDYAGYIVSSGLLNEELANSYIAAEQSQNELNKKAFEELERKEKEEREALKAQEIKDRQERKEAQAKAIEDMINSLTADEIEKINNIYEYTITEYSDIVGDNYNKDGLKDRLTKIIVMDKLYPESAIGNIKYYKELTAVDSKSPNRGNEPYIRGQKSVQDIREMFFGIILNMSSQMVRKLLSGEITAEDAQNIINKYDQQKQRQLDKMKTFYRYINGTGFVEASGEQIKIGDITSYGMEYQGKYILIEESSGAQVSSGKNKTEAIGKVHETINKMGLEKIERVIRDIVRKNGISPLLQTS